MVLGSTAGATEYQQELILSASEAASALIENGGTFTFNMQPTRPITLEEFDDIPLFSFMGGSHYMGEEADPVEEALRKQREDDLLRLLNMSFSHTP